MVTTDESAQDGPRPSVRRVQYGYSVDQVANNRNRRRRRKHRVLKLMTKPQIDAKFPVQCFKQAHEQSPLNPVNQTAEVVKNEKDVTVVSETVVVPPVPKRSLLPFLSRTNSVQTSFEMASDLESQTKTVAQPSVSDNTSDEFDDEEEDQAACLNLDTEGSLDMCAICIDKLEDNDQVRLLGCGHIFHAECIDPWLLTRQACCPMCKLSFYAPKPEDPMGPDPVHVIEAQYLAGLRAQETAGTAQTETSSNANSNNNNGSAARTTRRWFGRRTTQPATQIDSPSSITNTPTTPTSTPTDTDTVATPSIPASTHDASTASSRILESETVSGSDLSTNTAVTPDASTLATSR